MARPAGFLVKDFTPFDVRWPTPTHACWADDPLWANPGDGGAVSSWRNNSGGGNPAQATGSAQPTFRRSVAALGNRAAVEFVAASLQNLDFDISNIAQPFQVLVVAKLNSADSTVRRAIADGGTANGGIGCAATNVWSLRYGGTTLSSASADDANAHIFRATVNGVSSSLLVDGSSVASGDAGSAAASRFSLGSANNGGVAGNYWNGHVAFAGYYASGDSLVALETAMRQFYGI